ncbi:MAG: Zn finger-containing GTPase- Activating Protein for ARF [Claussenomyces sp. TS43310]|nr:MAG: Zn finger-containing GTPase- Activating Protein for ARF [Claussenomyces sp. TS43310]
MDAFKAAEIERMRLGGNVPWRTFFDAAEDNEFSGITFDDATIAERYSGDVGDEYKERLTAKVEGREYVKSASAPKKESGNIGTLGSQAGGKSQMKSGSGRTASPAAGSLGDARKAKVDDKYFGRLGAENAARPADLPPSQGGKYAGFGSAPPEPVRDPSTLPGFDDLQKDPVAALTKGFGWFTTTVGKTAKNVNDSYIQPTAQRLAEADLATQARKTAEQLAKTAQSGAKGASDSFNRFVEGEGSGGSRYKALDESKKDFWDSFGKPADKPSAIGTSAMKGGMGGSTQKDEWEAWD